MSASATLLSTTLAYIYTALRVRLNLLASRVRGASLLYVVLEGFAVRTLEASHRYMYFTLKCTVHVVFFCVHSTKSEEQLTCTAL
jgi:hypothetical protein